MISHGAAIRAWAGHVMPQVHTLLGTRALPNTAVIIADGDPESGWNLVGIEFPAAEDLQAQPAGPSQGGTQRV